MAKRRYRTLTANGNYRKWNEWDVDDVLEFTLESIGADQYKNPQYIGVVVERDFDEPEAHDKFTPGTKITINSVGLLNKMVEEDQIQIGDTARLVYKGMSPMKKGGHEGKLAHSIEISVADGEESGPSSKSEEDYDL